MKDRLVKTTNMNDIIKISELHNDFRFWHKETGSSSGLPSQKEVKTYFEKKWGPHGVGKVAGWRYLKFVPREMDLDTPANFDEKEL